MRPSPRLVAAVALTASLVVGAAGCGPGPEASPEVSTVVGDDDGLYRDPGRVVGERVVVAGSVREVLGEWVFRLAGEPASEHDLLVVHGGIAELRPGRALELTGMMRRFSLEDVERDLGIDLEDPAFEPYEGRYAIVAEDLRPLSPGTRFADEESLQGDEILATGTVAEVLAPAAIVVEGGLNTPEPTLVLTADPVAVTQGQEVTVQATVDEFERARARDVLGDLPVEVLERFSGFNYLEAGVVRGG